MQLNRPRISNSVIQMVSQVSFRLPWGAIRGIQFGNINSSSKFICVHGWQDNGGLFGPLLKNLPQENHYVALDLVGHGLSDHLPAGLPYNFLNYVYGLQYVVNEMKLTDSKFSLIGHSMGGNVAGLYTSIYPELISKLILLDAAGMPFIRQDFSKNVRTSVDQIIKLESKQKRPNSDYPKEELKKRLQSGLNIINSSLTDEAMETWFDRGATKLENGNYRINRDTKLNISHYNPPIMGISQMRLMHNVILESSIDVLHLHPTDPEKLTGAPIKEINQFSELALEFVK